jgi:hypothetical protein
LIVVNLVPTELNRHLANAVQYSIAADRFYITGKAGFWRLVGLGIAAFGIGIAVGIGFFAYSQVTRNSSSMDVLSAAFSKALSEAHLRGTAEGKVQIEPYELRLAEGQTISLDSNSRLRLDPKATVVVDGDINVLTPSVSVPHSTTGRPTTKIPAIANFTVFKSVSFDKGSVLTGWKFLTSAQTFPTYQYCYYTEKSDASPLEPVVYIGADEKLTRPKQIPKGFDIDAAFNECVWFNRDLP